MAVFGREDRALQVLVPFASCPPAPLADTNLPNRCVGGGSHLCSLFYLTLLLNTLQVCLIESMQNMSRIKMVPALRKLRIPLR